MRSARARVVDGKIVTRSKFPEGTKLLLMVDEPAVTVELTEEDEVAIRKARASIKAGNSISMGKLMAALARI